MEARFLEPALQVQQREEQVEATRCRRRCVQEGKGNRDDPIYVGSSSEEESAESVEMLVEADGYFDPSRTFGEPSKRIERGRTERHLRRRSRRVNKHSHRMRPSN